MRQGSVAFGYQTSITHNITEVHYRKGAGLLFQRVPQLLKAGSRQTGLSSIAQQENSVGRGLGNGRSGGSNAQPNEQDANVAE